MATIRQTIKLHQNDLGETKPDTVTYTWTPPEGATNIHIHGQEVSGDPPYVLSDKDPDQEIDIEYNAPDIPVGQDERTAVESLQTEYTGQDGAKQSTTVQLQTKIEDIGTLALAPAAPVSRSSDIVAQSSDMWEVTHYTDIKGITLTTTLCQDWLNVLLTEDYFAAVRAPAPTVPITPSVPLPFIFGGTYSQTVHLEDYSSFPPSTLMTMTVEYRPERLTFIANQLPAADGEQWVPLGLKKAEPANCPTGLDIAPNEWGLVYEGMLDLSHAPNNCEECILPLFYCYEGQNQPAGLAASAGLAMAGFDNIQAEGITCLGPHAYALTPYQFFPDPTDLSLHGVA